VQRARLLLLNDDAHEAIADTQGDRIQGGITREADGLVDGGGSRRSGDAQDVRVIDDCSLQVLRTNAWRRDEDLVGVGAFLSGAVSALATSNGTAHRRAAALQDLGEAAEEGRGSEKSVDSRAAVKNSLIPPKKRAIGSTKKTTLKASVARSGPKRTKRTGRKSIASAFE